MSCISFVSYLFCGTNPSQHIPERVLLAHVSSIHRDVPAKSLCAVETELTNKRIDAHSHLP